MIKGKHEVDGWTPVIKKYRRDRPSSSGSKEEMITLFVDNLPEDVGAMWFKKMFSNYGVVKDVFIPNKRSKRTGSRFGFVRYDCNVAADMAVTKANGLWIADKKLTVKEASYENKGKGRGKSQVDLKLRPRVPIIHSEEDNRPHHLRRSYAQVVKQQEEAREVSIKAQAQGNGWLTRSAVGKMIKLANAELVREVFKEEMDCDVQVRPMGGLYTLLTFVSKEVREGVIADHRVKEWFTELKPWNGEAASHSRLIWLKCRGMPLAAWCASNFKRIGEIWGEFITLGEETMNTSFLEVGKVLIITELEEDISRWINVGVNGRNYRVKVWEEPYNQTSQVSDGKVKLFSQSSEVEAEVDEDVEVNDTKKANEVDEVDEGDKEKNPVGEEDGRSTNIVDIYKNGNHTSLGTEKRLTDTHFHVAATSETVENVRETPEEAGGNGLGEEREVVSSESPNTSGHSGLKNSSPVADITAAHQGVGPGQLDPSRAPMEETILSLSLTSMSRKEERVKRRREISEMYYTEQSQEIDIGPESFEGNASATSSDIRRCNQIIIKELEDTIEVGKKLGNDFHGDEDVCLQKLIDIEMEEQVHHQQNQGDETKV